MMAHQRWNQITSIAPWWLAEVQVINPATFMLVNGTWTKLNNPQRWFLLMGTFLSRIFCLNFWIVGGSGDTWAIFIYSLGNAIMYSWNVLMSNYLQYNLNAREGFNYFDLKPIIDRTMQQAYLGLHGYETMASTAGQCRPLDGPTMEEVIVICEIPDLQRKCIELRHVP